MAGRRFGGLLIGVSGWFYLFYSRAAHKLTGIEHPSINRRRIILRRFAGVALLLLAVLFYWGFSTLDDQQPPILFVSIWGIVLFLLLVVLVLGLIDLRYTLRFYRERDAAKRSQ